MEQIYKKSVLLPLVVDLDGTFFNTDLLMEGVICLLKEKFSNIFKCIFWLLKGKMILKQNVFGSVQFDYNLLPLNKDLYKFLQAENANGRKLILATGSFQSCADEIARLYPIFDEVYGSTGSLNLKGKNKKNKLVELYGEKGFDYVGNSNSDLIIFKSSKHAYFPLP